MTVGMRCRMVRRLPVSDMNRLRAVPALRPTQGE